MKAVREITNLGLHRPATISDHKREEQRRLRQNPGGVDQVRRLKKRFQQLSPENGALDGRGCR